MKRIILEQDDSLLKTNEVNESSGPSYVETFLEGASDFGKGMQKGIFIAFCMFIGFIIILFILL